VIEEAVEAEAPVMVAVSRERIVRLREALGAAAERVAFVDMRELGGNPARIIPAWREFLRERALPEAGALGIGEPIWAGRTSEEIDECVRHEALLNLAFAGGLAWRLLCPYDLDGLEDHVIEAARRCHPLVAMAGASAVNPAFGPREELPRPFDGHLEEIPERAQEMHFDEAGLPAVRHAVTAWAGPKLGDEATEELVLAVDEVATNSIRYGGGSGTLRMWSNDDRMLCEVADRGEMEDPLLGRVNPGPDAMGGRGLWIVNRLCDLVQIRSSAAGSQVRMHKILA
jgi:anti-sigma regulatory factor (Ser/Thr protein kinase)